MEMLLIAIRKREFAKPLTNEVYHKHYKNGEQRNPDSPDEFSDTFPWCEDKNDSSCVHTIHNSPDIVLKTRDYSKCSTLLGMNCGKDQVCNSNDKYPIGICIPTHKTNPCDSTSDNSNCYPTRQIPSPSTDTHQ